MSLIFKISSFYINIKNSILLTSQGMDLANFVTGPTYHYFQRGISWIFQQLNLIRIIWNLFLCYYAKECVHCCFVFYDSLCINFDWLIWLKRLACCVRTKTSCVNILGDFVQSSNYISEAGLYPVTQQPTYVLLDGLQYWGLPSPPVIPLLRSWQQKLPLNVADMPLYALNFFLYLDWR